MPLKKDASGRRWIELELELPGTPEEVWQAIATGPGYAAWLAPAAIDGREGGRVSFTFGPGLTSSGSVTAWQPPFRLAYEEPGWSGEAPPLATEITVEARGNGTCTLRMVHSLFASSDDWDDELSGMENDLQASLDILRIYMTHFRGLPVASSRSSAGFDGSQDEAWRMLREALGLSTAGVGEIHDTSLHGAPQLVGGVERIGAKPAKPELTLRVEKPGPGIVLFGAYEWGDRVSTVVTLRFYGDEADKILAEQRLQWDAWLTGIIHEAKAQ